MTITLITEEEHATILRVAKNHPLLTYNAKGYDKPDRTKWSTEDTEAYWKVNVILRKSIRGFVSFTNFKHSKRTGLTFRFQYDYNADIRDQPTCSGLPFTGVGYLGVNELRFGFKNERQQYTNT